MKKQIQIALSLLMLSISSVSMPLRAFACSFASQTYFTYTTHPDFPLTGFAAGKLGILRPEYARSYLLCAYRYLKNEPLSTEEQKQLVELWNERLLATDFSNTTDTSAWLKARAQVPGASKIEQLFTDRPVSKEESWQTYCNCQSSAFETAIKHLQELIAKHGASAAQVKDWLTAQDKVFSNCGGAPYSDNLPPPAVPEALSPGADAALQKDRAYQIAAANFYAQNFEIAAKQFQTIADDAASPWKQLSAYLAIRAMIRQASLPKTIDKKLLEHAAEKIKHLMSDPANSNLSNDLKALQNYVAARLTPETHLKDIAALKISKDSTAELTKTIDNLLGESESEDRPKYSTLPAALKDVESVDWIMTFQSDDESAKQHAIEKWKAGHALPWLVSVADKIEAKDPLAQTIIDECSKQNNAGAKWTLFYNSLRLLREKGKNDQVRAELDAVLSKPPAELSLGGLNMLKTQRLALAQNLEELVKFGFQTPAATCSNGGCQEVPDDMDEIVKSGKVKAEAAVFTPEAGNIIDNKLPLSVLKQLAQSKLLPQANRSNIAWTSWVRAILVGDDTSARELATLLKGLNKEKSKLLDAYLAATNAEDKKFAACFLMLQFSSANPFAAWGPLQDDGYGDSSGWWWGSAPSASLEDGAIDMDPLFLTASQKAQCKQQMAKLASAEGGPDLFGHTVLAYAKTHPSDPRVPQALHLVVKATRYGSPDDTKMSKQAFQLLHSRYKGNSWTKNTPYYY